MNHEEFPTTMEIDGIKKTKTLLKFAVPIIILILALSVIVFIFHLNSSLNDGIKSFNNRNYNAALLIFEKCKKNDPKNIEIQYCKTLAEIELGLYDDAKQSADVFLRNVSFDNIDKLDKLDMEYPLFYSSVHSKGLKFTSIASKNVAYIFDWLYHYNLINSLYDDNESLLREMKLSSLTEQVYLEKIYEINQKHNTSKTNSGCLACGGEIISRQRMIGGLVNGIAVDGFAHFITCTNCGWEFGDDMMRGTFQNLDEIERKIPLNSAPEPARIEDSKPASVVEGENESEKSKFEETEFCGKGIYVTYKDGTTEPLLILDNVLVSTSKENINYDKFIDKKEEIIQYFLNAKNLGATKVAYLVSSGSGPSYNIDEVINAYRTAP